MMDVLARDVMTTKVLSLTADMTIRQIAKLLVEHNISGAPVVDGDNLPIGMVTEKDLIAEDANGARKSERDWWLTHLAEGEPLSPRFLASLDRSERLARDIMASPVLTIPETTVLPEIARLFLDLRIKRLPVVRDGRMVGLVSRADLVRQMAKGPTESVSDTPREGLLSEALVSLESHFIQAQPEPPAAAIAEETKEPVVTANAFSALVEEFDQQKTLQHDVERLAATEQRKALVKDLTDHHIENETWHGILRRALSAAETGQKEMLLLRFPCELCSDGGRAINAPLPDWPETLRGEAAEIYQLWDRDLKPNGFHLTAQVLDFPGGIPGDIGLTLTWGG
ncbi:MAG TPA: CBS domain-containing protein [Telmatospirillum sp.]|nr:CBS domain-containing protein [Telmatospirillum sp.]